MTFRPTAEGHDVADSAATFAALYRLLASHNVRIAMAGDTHDFEYYREEIGDTDATRVMHHFVNGGGGAYLSIGTALDFPKQPAARDWAFYPRTDELHAKLDAETPLVEAAVLGLDQVAQGVAVQYRGFSGIFDFNRAPFLPELSLRCAWKDRKHVSFSFPTAYTVRCAGATCRPAARCCRRERLSMLPSNSSSRWAPTAADSRTAQKFMRHASLSTRCTTRGSRFMLRTKPLFSNTFSIGMFSGRTSATNSWSSGLARNRGEMPQQLRADALPLVLVNHCERHLCYPGF